jgi:3-oxoacyl-[acyl-carrier-protein] synthase-3
MAVSIPPLLRGAAKVAVRAVEIPIDRRRAVSYVGSGITVAFERVRIRPELPLSLRNRSIIIGTGSYLPARRVHNSDYLEHEFYDSDGSRYARSTREIIDTFERVTGIAERRFVTDDLVTSDIASLAAQDALQAGGIDPESLDYVIVAHNFGDVAADNRRSDFVPSLAARVKERLGIRNPGAVAYDISFGCPGWLQGLIQADYFLASGDAKRALIVGAEILSRVSDPHDRDSMIYADGAGAVVLESVRSDEPVGVLCHGARSDAVNHARLLRMGPSYNPDYGDNSLFLKMSGHQVYEYALRTVPQVIKECMERAQITLRDVKMMLLHQANAKMDEAIVRRLGKLYGLEIITPDAVPMTISWLGNSSVATLPTLLDLMLKGKLPNYALGSGDVTVFASVGAGMNANAMVYRVP